MPFYAAFANQIHPFQKRGGLWIVCTGRTLSSLKKASGGMARAGIVPDYLLASHWIVYSHAGGVWLLRPLLSLRIRLRQRHENTRLDELVNTLALQLRDKYSGIRIANTRPRYFRAQFDTEAEARDAFWMPDDLHATCNRCDIEIRTGSFEKSVAVRTLCVALGVRAAEVLAIGDGRSDLAMLSAEVSGQVGCPGNSKSEVAELVSRRGGHVSRKNSLAGVIDVLDAFASGRTDSSLPSNWKPPTAEFGAGSLSSPREQHGYGMWVAEVAMLVAAGVITFIVFAAFGIIPFGPLIVRPLKKFLEILGWS